jgi:hypothetical protein
VGGLAPQALQVGDGGDDDGAGVREGVEDLAAPLVDQVGGTDHQGAGGAGEAGGDDGHGSFSRAHFADEEGGAVALEAEGGGAGGVGLGAEEAAAEGREGRGVAVAGVVLGREVVEGGLDEGVLEGLEELGQGEGHGTSWGWG